MEAFHVFVVSDGTGETAYRMLKAAMRQFKREALITRFANVRDEERIREITETAAKNRTLVLYTFAHEELRRLLRNAARESGTECIDLLGPLMDELEAFFKEEPVSQPGLLHQVDEDYFARIEAIEYAIQHDDSRSIKDLETADIVIVGVSRTSKTPLSIYLAQEGWKVANIPVVLGLELPSELFRIDQGRIACLTIDPFRLSEIRRARLKQMGLQESTYAEPRRILEELQYAQIIYNEHPLWPVIDVTGKSIEEASQEVLDILFGKDRKLQFVQ
ncbi:MAG: kinase/pyrophosphorylase [Acidobacteria bacterium]|nr:kinase/pyrophosphorylase [Acidobacteriota bacterium]